VYVWDLKPPSSGQQAGGGSSGGASGAPRAEVMRHHHEPVVAVGWSSDCAMLVSCDKGGGVAFWQCQ
jgi:hypothetical protein